MPRNKTSNDLDHVKKDPKPSRTPKGRPPKPWPLPMYKPVKIKQPWTNGHSQLPSTITPDDPYAIFNRGLDQGLADLRTKWNSVLEWGKLYGRLSSDKKVMEFAWKDQNVVLFMSTVSNGQKTVKRLRRRPAKTATNARTSRAVFGEMTTKELDIPEFINMYNHYMNGVDNADQLLCYYSTQRVHLKSWKPLWHFLLDSTIVNSYLLHHCV